MESEKELQTKIIERVERDLSNRRKVGTLESQADFLCGAMSAMTMILPESLSMPPNWVISTIRGDVIGK